MQSNGWNEETVWVGWQLHDGQSLPQDLWEVEPGWTEAPESQYAHCLAARTGKHRERITYTVPRVFWCLGQVHAWLREDRFWARSATEAQVAARVRRDARLHYQEVLQRPQMEQVDHRTQKARKDLLFAEGVRERRESQEYLWGTRTPGDGKAQNRLTSQANQGGENPEIEVA